MENLPIISLLLLLLTILLFSAIGRSKSKRRSKLPPGPPPLPLIGNFHQIAGKPFHQYFRRLSKTYGSLVHVKLGSRSVIVANSSKMAEQILKSQDLNFCSRPPLLALHKLSYGGFDMAFAPYGPYWREMRKLSLLHLLSSARVKSFRPIREDEVATLIGKISGKASRSETVNLSDEIVFLTSTIISRIAFGKRFEHGSGESRAFDRNILEFQTALSGFYWTDYFPRLAWLDRLTGKTDHLDRVFRSWDSFYQNLIDEHSATDRPETMHRDVLDILLQLRDDESRLFDISLDQIKAILMDVFFASTDTVATTLVWAMTALVKNPAAMAAAQEEIRSVAGKRKKMVEEEDIAAASLPYFNAVLKESLRMYFPIPLLLGREAIRGCAVGGFEIPAAALVYVNGWALSRDPEVWENPEEFRPERFMEGEEKLWVGQDLGFIPFGAGRRGCPGITMAVATLETVLANLLYAFDWKVPEGMKVDTEALTGITLHKKYPLCLVANNFI
ncbi:6,7,8-trihydroxycoumarin synthase-like [Andrographis paniculata]|uniref:6,7,8-trihydroxycoumarin synthase-like n=1 Tax=Andrographis paniculata TaxID=175694 RepID=UPI0021E90E3D|nr:6,7,8-trihydroxycoumarin synthase-like [Andrographis paniculata]